MLFGNSSVQQAPHTYQGRVRPQAPLAARLHDYVLQLNCDFVRQSLGQLDPEKMEHWAERHRLNLTAINLNWQDQRGGGNWRSWTISSAGEDHFTPSALLIEDGDSPHIFPPFDLALSLPAGKPSYLSDPFWRLNIQPSAPLAVRSNNFLAQLNAEQYRHACCQTASTIENIAVEHDLETWIIADGDTSTGRLWLLAEHCDYASGSNAQSYSPYALLEDSRAPHRDMSYQLFQLDQVLHSRCLQRYHP